MSKHILTAVFCSTLLLAPPALAQDTDAPEDGQIRQGWGMLSEGSRLILEGLMDEMQPLIEEQMLPLLQELGDMIDDLSAYHPPEFLPNGDIILRRRVPLDPDAEPEADADPEAEIEL